MPSFRRDAGGETRPGVSAFRQIGVGIAEDLLELARHGWESHSTPNHRQLQPTMTEEPPGADCKQSLRMPTRPDNLAVATRRGVRS